MATYLVLDGLLRGWSLSLPDIAEIVQLLQAEIPDNGTELIMRNSA